MLRHVSGTLLVMRTNILRTACMLDPDIVLDALYGPFYHRLLVPYDGAPISAAYVDSLVDTVFRGLER
jgi:hypothetical protein